MTGLKTIVLSMPIKQKKSQHDLSLKHQEWLIKNFKNVEAYTLESRSNYLKLLSLVCLIFDNESWNGQF